MRFYDVLFGIAWLFVMGLIWANTLDQTWFLAGLLMLIAYVAGGVKYRAH